MADTNDTNVQDLLVRLAALEAEHQSLQDELARRPALRVDAPPLRPGSGRCAVCGEFHQKGCCSLCPACRQPSGTIWFAGFESPPCPTCGSHAVVRKPLTAAPVVPIPRMPRYEG